MLGNEGIEKSDKGGMNYVLLCVGEIMELDEVKVTKELDEWVDPPPKTANGDHTFDQVEK